MSHNALGGDSRFVAQGSALSGSFNSDSVVRQPIPVDRQMALCLDSDLATPHLLGDPQIKHLNLTSLGFLAVKGEGW